MKSVLTTFAAVLALTAGTAFAQTAPVKPAPTAAAPAPVAAPAPAKAIQTPAPAAASVPAKAVQAPAGAAVGNAPLNTVVHPAVQPGVKELPQAHADKQAPKAAVASPKHGHKHHKQHKQGHKHHKHAQHKHQAAK